MSMYPSTRVPGPEHPQIGHGPTVPVRTTPVCRSRRLARSIAQTMPKTDPAQATRFGPGRRLLRSRTRSGHACALAGALMH
eukprot:512260-Rhodomonas_salina.3